MSRRASTDPAQGALFTLAELGADGEGLARAEWQARFVRAEWVPPPRSSAAPVLGWACPDCGLVEPNVFLLGNNHGWHPDRPGWIPFAQNHDGRCVRQVLLASHAIYDARRAMIRHLIGEGLDDEQIAARIDVWNAATVAGYRKDEAKASARAARAAKAKGEIVKVGHGSGCPCAYCGGPCGCPSCELSRSPQQALL